MGQRGQALRSGTLNRANPLPSPRPPAVLPVGDLDLVVVGTRLEEHWANLCVTPAWREDEHQVSRLLQSLEGRSNGGLNLRVAADPCHAKGAAR